MSLRIGILSFANLHAYSYGMAVLSHPGAELVGMSDHDAYRRRQAAELFEIPTYATEEELIEQGLDGAIVASETVLHRSQIEQLAAGGVKAIFCEKPLATSVADAKAITDCCRKAGVKLATAFPCRYSPVFRQALKSIRDGKIGSIRAICATNRTMYPPGWYADPRWSGGGAVMDQTSHVADLNWLLLGGEAVDVYAEIGSVLHRSRSEDAGLLTIGYKNDVFSTLDTSWSRPTSYPTWGDVTLQIVGVSGVVNISLFAQNLVHYSNAGANWQSWGSSLDRYMIEDFLRTVAGEESELLATGLDGLRGVKLLEAAYKSATTGHPVSI